MTAIEDIEDALIIDIKANITGLKTVDTLEKDFNEDTMSGLFLKDPFVLMRYVGLEPVEGERNADGGSGMIHEQHMLVVGAKSLRSRQEAQRGCYSILNDLRVRYDGKTILSVDSNSIIWRLEKIQFLFFKDGITVYGLLLGRYDS